MLVGGTWIFTGASCDHVITSLVVYNVVGMQVSDNLYSLKAWVTCTSHVHEDTSLKTRQIKVKKTRYKIIN